MAWRAGSGQTSRPNINAGAGSNPADTSSGILFAGTPSSPPRLRPVQALPEDVADARSCPTPRSCRRLGDARLLRRAGCRALRAPGATWAMVRCTPLPVRPLPSPFSRQAMMGRRREGPSTACRLSPLPPGGGVRRNRELCSGRRSPLRRGAGCSSRPLPSALRLAAVVGRRQPSALRVRRRSPATPGRRRRRPTRADPAGRSG
jgi:hypothetical protein